MEDTLQETGKKPHPAGNSKVKSVYCNVYPKKLRESLSVAIFFLSPGAMVAFSLVALVLVAAVCVTVATGVVIAVRMRRDSRVDDGERADN